MSALPVINADAIVVGAGLNGSWVAKELTAGGMDVALIDAGSVLPESSFTIDRLQNDVFNPRYHLFRLKLLLKGENDLAFNKFVNAETSRLFLDRRRDPYLTPAGQDFSWLRVRAVGGRGHFWGRVMLRLTDEQLSVPGFEWPIKYGDLAPYYSEVEKLLEMGGALSRSNEVPDGDYLHERTLHPLEQEFCSAVQRRWPLRRAVVNHVAEYEPASLSPMLKAAFSTGRLFLYPDKAVAALTIEAGNRITGVTTICTKNGETQLFTAPYVILAASAFESVRILLNSQSERFPNGVGNNTGLVGSRILEHIVASKFGELPARIRSKHPIHRHNPFKLNSEPHGFYMPSFVHSECREARFRFGYGVQGTISADTGLFYLGAFGETVPSENNRLRIDSTRKDRFGIPIASIDFKWGVEDLAMWENADRALSEMIDAFQRDTDILIRNPLTNKAYSMLLRNRPPIPGSNHECGGARMGLDAKSSVVDQYNRVWDAPNLLICDAACFPSIPHQNPTLTTMALAVRAARKLLADS